MCPKGPGFAVLKKDMIEGKITKNLKVVKINSISRWRCKFSRVRRKLVKNPAKNFCSHTLPCGMLRSQKVRLTAKQTTAGPSPSCQDPPSSVCEKHFLPLSCLSRQKITLHTHCRVGCFAHKAKRIERILKATNTVLDCPFIVLQVI